MTHDNGAVTKRESTEVAKPTKLPKGFEEPIEREDLLIPRAKLLQPNSPEVIEPAYEGKFRAGQIINSLTKDVLDAEFVPVFKFTNWIRFNPRDEKAFGYMSEFGPGDMIWSCNDPLDERVQTEGKWGEDGSPPIATKFLNFFCVFKGSPMPVILSFSKTSFKAGKQLLSLAKFAGCDMFARKYMLTAKQEINSKGTYFVFCVTPCGNADDIRAGEAIWAEFSQKDIKVDQEAQNNDEVPF